jgi:RNA ligase (TIGR02306 family)
MSEFHVQVVRIGTVEKHPDADTLSITKVLGGYPVIFQNGRYKEGDLAVYVPVDAVVRPNDPRFDFLGDHLRVRAKRLRGVFSMGLLTPAEPGWVEGQNVAAELGITKYLPPWEKDVHGLNEEDPGVFPVYDLEGLRHYPNELAEGEEVVLEEKIHGENARFCVYSGRLYCCSRTKVKKDMPDSQWWRAARKYDLETKLSKYTCLILYGEVHGYTSGFPYGVKSGDVGLRFFDMYDLMLRKWLDFDVQQQLLEDLGLPSVPVLYRGPWSGGLANSLASGASTLGKHIREGVVVRPVEERVMSNGRRCVLKLHGEEFLLRNKLAQRHPPQRRQGEPDDGDGEQAAACPAPAPGVRNHPGEELA